MMTIALAALMAAAPMTAGDLPAMPDSLDDATLIEGWVGRKRSPSWSEEIATAYRRGECTGAVNYEGGKMMEIDVLFLIGERGKLLRVAPVNVGCPRVEEYVAKRIKGTLASSFPNPGAEPKWYRSQVRFLWTQ